MACLFEIGCQASWVCGWKRRLLSVASCYSERVGSVERDSAACAPFAASIYCARDVRIPKVGIILFLPRWRPLKCVEMSRAMSPSPKPARSPLSSLIMSAIARAAHSAATCQLDAVLCAQLGRLSSRYLVGCSGASSPVCLVTWRGRSLVLR